MNVSMLCSLRGRRKRRIRLWRTFGEIVFITEEYKNYYIAEISKAVSARPSDQGSLEAN
jgi:hypothetical protein